LKLLTESNVARDVAKDGKRRVVHDDRISEGEGERGMEWVVVWREKGPG